MLRIIVKKITASFVLLSLVTCDNYEFPKSPYPRIETLSVTNVSTSGVTFHANILQLGSTPITNHGFVWSLGKNPTLLGDVNKIELEGIPSLGSLTANITSGLYPDSLYYVKAFIATDSYTVYGEVVPFKSMGGTPPAINNFIPAEGTWGDTVTIEGTNFSTRLQDNEVKFETLAAQIISCSGTSLTCVVPSDILNKAVPIYLTVAGNTFKSATDFKITTPIIENFFPQTGTFDDIITIIGKNFSTIPTRNAVKFNEHIAEIVSASSTIIKVKVPTQVNVRSNMITITLNLQTASASTTFNLSPPNLSSISTTEGFMGSNLIITGDNFNPSTTGNIVLLGGTPATILNATKNQLSIKIPEGIYKSRSFPIEVIAGGQSVYSNQLFTLQNAWIRKAYLHFYPNENYGVTSFTADEKAYIGLGYLDSFQNIIVKFDPVNNEWSGIEPFPGDPRIGATSFVIDDIAYVGLGGVNDFYKFNPLTDSWTRIVDFPYPNPISNAIGLSLNGKGYVITTSNEDNNFWEFDPESEGWTALSNISAGDEWNTHIPIPKASFTIGDRLFVYSESMNNQYNQLWEYNFSTNGWMDRVPYELNEADSFNFSWIGFSLNGFGYVVGNNGILRQYNPTTDTWATIENDHFFNPSGAFVINNKVYIATLTGQFWEFDPTYE